MLAYYFKILRAYIVYKELQMNITNVKEGKVVLISGGGKIFTDIAARFVGSERSLDDIISSPYNKNIVKNILNSNHNAALEFDDFIFGIEGYSRICETQLVRKRHASYLIKSGRINKHGKRSYDLVLPDDSYWYPDSLEKISYKDNNYNIYDILSMTEIWYNMMVEKGYPEERLRRAKAQATEFKAIISMNVHGLRDWFKIRCCKNAEFEIRDLANKMLRLCKEVSPDLFEKAGANCISLGYCPENGRQSENCIGKIPTHNDVLNMIADDRAEMEYRSMCS